MATTLLPVRSTWLLLILQVYVGDWCFARVGVERDRYSKTSESGVDINFVKKIRKKTEIPPQLITQPGREKQDKWTVVEKESHKSA